MYFDEDDEGKGKDEKIYDLFKQAMQEQNLVVRLKWAILILRQLEPKHIEQFPKGFSIQKEMQWLYNILKDNEFKKRIELRYRVTEGTEGYKYFDKIANDNPNDVFNYDRDTEDIIIDTELRLIDLFGYIVKTLDIEISDGEEL